MKKLLTVACVFLLCYTHNLSAQTCPVPGYTPNSWEWPSHSHWMASSYLHNVSNTGITTTFSYGGAIPWNHVAYEGTISPSDDFGNPLFFSNGKWVYTATNPAVLQDNSLRASDASVGSRNSAVQGIIVVRHPLDPDTYHIFTGDDASSGGNFGLSHYTFDNTGTKQTGPTALVGSTTEAMAATVHANGVDIWVTVHEAGSRRLHAYLVTCNGVEPAVVTNNVAPNVGTGENSVGGMEFSVDGRYFAEVYKQGGGAGSTFMEFNNQTGVFSNAINLSSKLYYDVEFSPDGTKVYCANTTGNVFQYDISTFTTAAINASETNVRSGGGGEGALEIGADGKLYIHLKNQGMRRIAGDLNGPPGGLSVENPSIAANGHLGLPNMYLPPAEEPDIQEVGPYCTTDGLVDLSTTWVCSGISAEDPDSVLSVYSGPGIIDGVKGIFDPSVAGDGSHEIIYVRCSVNDTITIVVNTCGGCTAPTSLDVTPQPSELCVGDDQTYTVTFSGTATLDDYYITWFDDDGTDVQGPTTDGTAGSDEYDLNNAQLTHDGTWTVRIEDGDNDDASCYSEVTFDIGITAVPVASIAISPNDSICDGETVTLTASGGAGGATYDWADIGGTNDGTTRNNLTPAIGNTDYTVTIDNGNGCTDDTTITITVIANPIASVAFSPNDTVCEGTDVDVTASGGTTYVWEDASTANPRTISTTGNYTLTAANYFCTDDTTFRIEVVDVPIASIAISPNDSICDGETVTLTASDGIGGTSTYGWADMTGSNDGAIRSNLTPAIGNTNYTVTADNGNGCTDDTTITITVIANPLATIAFNPNDTVCDGTDVDVTPSGGTTLTWEDASTSNPRTISATGNYTLTAANFFCTDDTTFHIEVLPVPTLAAQGGPLTICDGDSTGTIALTSNPVGATFTWTSVVTDLTGTLADETTGALALTNHTPAYSGSGAQGSVTYSIVPTLNGCVGAAEDYVIQVDAQPVATVGADIQICDDNTTLTGNDPSPLSGLWTNVDRDGSGVGPGTITTNTQFNSTLTGLVNGDSTYLNWTVSNGVCGDSTAQLIVNVTDDEIPTVTISANPTSICSGEPVDLTATGTGTGAAPTYEFFNGTTSIRGTIVNGNTYMASTDFTNTGNEVDTLSAIVEMTSNTACLAVGASATVRDTIEIIVDPNPSTSTPGLDQTLCSDTTNMAATLPTSGNGTWEYVSGPGTIAASEINDIDATVTGLDDSAPTVYAWVIRSDNDLCPVDSAVVTITNTGSLTAPAVSSQSTTLCETDAYPTLTGTALNAAAVPAETGIWSSLDGAGIAVSGTIDANITASSMTAGNSYQFVYTTSNGLCPDKTDTVTININAAPTVNLSPTTANSCGLTPYGLSATASNYASISWASDGGGTFSDSDSTLTDFTPPAQNGTTYNLTITAAGIGTCSDATASLALTVNAGPTVNAGIEDTICEGTSLDLSTRSTIASASGHSGLSWTASVGSFDDNTLLNPTYTPPAAMTSGDITLTLTANGTAPCLLVDDEFTVTIRENPTVPNFTHSTTAICASSTTGVPVDLVDDGSLVEADYVYTWYNASDNSILSGPTNGNAAANLTGLSNGDQVYLQADYITSICPSIVTNSTASAVTIDAEPDLSVAASSAAIVCVNDAFVMSASDAMTTAIDPAYSATYAWTDGNGSPLTGGSLDLNGSESVAGSYDYILTATNGLCSDNLSMSILVKAPYVEAITDEELIDQGEIANVSATHNSLETYTYDWMTTPIGMDGDGSTSQNMAVSPESSTIYIVTATLTNVDDPSSTNCSASSSVNVDVIEPIRVPDAFTPNGDGINDSLTIIGVGTYRGARVEIYNRWGNVVYSVYGGHNYTAIPWDGKLNGKVCPAGVYYYTIDYGLISEEGKAPLSGSFMLIE